MTNLPHLPFNYPVTFKLRYFPLNLPKKKRSLHHELHLILISNSLKRRKKHESSTAEYILASAALVFIFFFANIRPFTELRYRISVEKQRRRSNVWSKWLTAWYFDLPHVHFYFNYLPIIFKCLKLLLFVNCRVSWNSNTENHKSCLIIFCYTL